MRCEYLFEKYDINDEPVYFTDPECQMPYTGTVEEYLDGKTCWEADVVDGMMEGIEKIYNHESGKLEAIYEKKHNLDNGLSIEYYENGKIKNIFTTIDNLLIDFYDYDENGCVSSKGYMDENDIHYRIVKDKISELRDKYNLEKLNEEILEFGNLISLYNNRR